MRSWTIILVAMMISTAAPVRSAEQASTYNDFWREARKGKHSAIRYKDFTLVIKQDGKLLYYITRPGHFAHPGVLKRTAETDGENRRYSNQVWFFTPDKGDREKQRWVAQAERLDRELANKIN